MINQEIINKVKNKLAKIDNTESEQISLSKQDNLLIEGVINHNLPILQNITLNSYSDIATLEKSSKKIYDAIKDLKDEIDTNLFIKKNKNFDDEKLRELYVKLDLKTKFPYFDIEKYLKLINKPFYTVKNPIGKNIRINPYIVKKYLIAINQMIFNEMDLYILNIGKEGSGKSCWSSQQLLYFYVFLKEVGLIKYDYKIEKMFFTDIKTFLKEHELQNNDDYFKIEVLDEGNDLNRANFRDEENQDFKREMRTDRKQLRIILINMQQIGELDTSISLSRINFIFDCQMQGKLNTGTLRKGFGDVYIIPRGDYIYSEIHEKVFYRSEILNEFAKFLDKKKDYYVGLPKKYAVNEFTFANVWGFDKQEYDKHVKDSNKRTRFSHSYKITLEQMYILVTKLSRFKDYAMFDLKNKSDKRMYDVAYKMFQKWNKYFDLNPEKFKAVENHYKK